MDTEGDFETTNEQPNEEGMIDNELAEEELGPDEAPPAEYPYPGAVDKNLLVAPETKMPGVGYASERPKKINEDTGTYYYDTNVEAVPFSGRTDIVSPTKTTKTGEYVYDKTPLQTPYVGGKDREAPIEMKGTGEYYYSVESSPERGSASFRFGLLAPPTLRNAETGTTFESIYTSNQSLVFLADYESKITGKIGRVGIKFGSGVYTAQGVGKFRNTATTRRSDDIPEERYTFLLFPNSVTGVYRFQYSEKQVFVPFIEGGLGYYGFMELRDDNITPKIGGAAVTIAAGGANFNLDWLDRRSIRSLDNEYGVNHVWLTTEFRVLVGLNKTYDFTSNVFNAGILLEF